MKELSRFAQTVQASSTLAIDALFKDMKSQGMDVIGFGTGEPDFGTPEHIKEAGIQAIRDDFTKYTPTPGIPDLRAAVCTRLSEDYGLNYTSAQIVVASGAKHALYAALRAVINPGDEVVVAAPYWVSYSEMVAMVGGVPVIVSAEESAEFKITPAQLEAAVTPKTKLFMINNPSNPTGMLYSKEQLIALMDICTKHDLYVLSDEIYSELVYDNLEFTSIPSLSKDLYERTILINGVSKSYAMTGWRIGYAAASTAITKLMSNYLSHSTGAPCSIAQKAAVVALTASQEPIKAMREEFALRRNALVERINAIDGVSCTTPNGAFYVMMNIRELIGTTIRGTVITDGDVFASEFLKHGLVAVVPGSGFGAPEFVRWSYANSMENIHLAIDRLETYLAG